MILALKRCGVIVSILWFLIPFYASAQIAWWHSMGSSGQSENAEQHVVHNDNIYVCGYFEHSIVLGNVTLTSRGESDIFLYKAKSDGTIVWAKSLGGSSYDGDVGLDVDPNGNVYLAGGFINQLYLDNSIILSASNSYWNSFFSKFDENGNLLWVKGILGNSTLSEVRVWGNIAVNSNSFVVAATFSGSISVDGLSFPGSTFEPYLLIAKFDLGGNLIWSKLPVGARDCSKIFLDDAGTCYLTGPFVGTMQFDSYSLVGNSNYSDVYLVKLDPVGHTLWLKGGIKTSSRSDNNWSTSFTINPAGDVYLIGIFKGDVAFDALTLHGNTDPEYSIVDTFIVKYNANGEVMSVLNFGDDYHAFGTDIVYSPFGLFVLGRSAAIEQYFSSLLDHETLQSSPPNYIEAYGIPLQLSVVGEKRFYISGVAASVKNQTANGGWDGVLIKVEDCSVPPPGSVSAIAGATTLCPGDEVTYSVDPVANAHHFVWEIPPIFIPNGTIQTAESEIFLKVTSAGSATISVYAQNECDQSNNTSTVSIKIDDYPPTPIITKDTCDSWLSISLGENIEWFRNNQLITGANSMMIIVADSGVYKVRIHNSCYSRESAEVSVYPIVEMNKLFFPNVITPNNDRRNDSFHVDKSLLDSRLKIFNRWGSLVYQSNSYDNSWQGETVSSGVYFYYLENSCYTKPFKGSIQVIK